MFITLEGPEGSGKTSKITPLGEFIRQRGYKVLTTREPGGTAIGDQVRAVLCDLAHTNMAPRAETLLFQAARAQLVEQVIRPALAAGEIVICDRYADSTLAYQGYGQGGDLVQIRDLVNYATGGLKPDLTLLFDLDVEEGLRRKQNNPVEWNRLDAYALAYHQRVRQGYLELARQEPARWVIVDAGQSPAAVQADLVRIVSDRLELN
ncbi:MAG TPA: dTMP kinase [Anaerolineaceae bacterium]|jgi:dTMP kinase